MLRCKFFLLLFNSLPLVSASALKGLVCRRDRWLVAGSWAGRGADHCRSLGAAVAARRLMVWILRHSLILDMMGAYIEAKL